MNLQDLCHNIYGVHKLQTYKNGPVFGLLSKYHHVTVVDTNVTDIEQTSSTVNSSLPTMWHDMICTHLMWPENMGIKTLKKIMKK